MTHHFYIVDVFAERPYTGNPLAVVVGKEEIPKETMQLIAAEINFSETTFLSPVPEENGGYRVHIFTPSQELDFAGHPLLGTAHVIRQHCSGKANEEIILNIKAGQVPVNFETGDDGKEVAWFQAPPMSFGETANPNSIASSLGIAEKDIETKTPIQVISAGTAAMIVPLKSLDALKRCKFNLEKYADLKAKGFPPLIYLFTQQTHDVKNDFCVRFFFEAHGVREDPATGNGAAFFGEYLLQHKYFSESNLSLRIEQGHEIRRPSLVMLSANMSEGVNEVYVGGTVISIVQGKLL